MAFKLVETFEIDVSKLSLQQALNLFFDKESHIPFIIWLLENPESPIPFPGKISLYNHDYIHILLGRDKSSQDEAFVVGFTMGNDAKTTKTHVKIFKFFSQYLYPSPFKFSKSDLQAFDLGITYGRKIKTKNLNEIDMSKYDKETVDSLRKLFEIDVEEIKLLRQFEHWLIPDSTTSKELVSA